MRSPGYQRWIDESYRRVRSGRRLAPSTVRPLPTFEGEEVQDVDSGETTAIEL